ncbi:Allatostatin-A receptor [Exaiptasia diaphana]|nr:Allatostatin-A receptor [Exaiptasia diaphana]
MNNSSLIPNNATNNSPGYYCKYDEPDTQLEYNAKRIAVIILITLGLTGNIFVIVLALKYTVRKNWHNLIINMAVSDTLYILLNLIMDIPWLSEGKLLIKYPDGILGDISCKTKRFLLQVSYRVSLVTLLIISIERFRATRRTLQRSHAYTFRQQIAVIGICWLIPMALEAHWWHNSILNSETGRCVLLWSKLRMCFTIISSFVNLISIIVIFVLSISTIRRLSRPRAIHAHLNQQQRKARARRTQAAIRMVLASADDHDKLRPFYSYRANSDSTPLVKAMK